MTTATTDDPVLQEVPLGAQWPTVDPFLFCAHHLDRYPAGDDRLGWDLDLFPKSVEQMTLGMLEILRGGGFTTGGLMFDTKLRRQSIARASSPPWAGRYCQNSSPMPDRRRPCSPSCTVAARCRASAISGGRAEASASACRLSPAGRAETSEGEAAAVMPPRPWSRRGRRRR